MWGGSFLLINFCTDPFWSITFFHLPESFSFTCNTCASFSVALCLHHLQAIAHKYSLVPVVRTLKVKQNTLCISYIIFCEGLWEYSGLPLSSSPLPLPSFCTYVELMYHPRIWFLQKLEADKIRVDEQRMLLQVQLKEQTTKMESIQNVLSESEMHAKLEHLNQSLLSIQQTVTTLQEGMQFIHLL